ncbi:MAG: hypothetical protein ABFC57_17295 [Veillonellales bacterium]
MSQKAAEFIIPPHPTPAQIEEMLAICSNQIATLADILTGYWPKLLKTRAGALQSQ